MRTETPLTLSSSYRRLHRWLARMDIGCKPGSPGWIPEDQRQCWNALNYLDALVDPYQDARVGPCRLSYPIRRIRRRQGNIQIHDRGKWRHLCTVEELQNEATRD